MSDPLTQSLDIFLHHEKVGTLSRLSHNATFFTFDEAYEHHKDRPILSQSYHARDGTLLLSTRAYGSTLPPFFENVLPEGPLRRYVAQEAGVKSSQSFELLRFLGHDLPGALVAVLSYEKIPDTLIPINKEDVSKDSLLPYRFSLAGVQLKFSALMEHHGGLTLPAKGIGGNWIVKLPSLTYPHVPENEYAMMHLAHSVGIHVPAISLVSLKDISGLPPLGLLQGSYAFVIKRFDRHNAKRLHMEDFAQVYGLYPDDKYDKVSFTNITQMVWTLTGESGLCALIQRLVFMILTGNGDMHLKNWSFLYEDGRTPTLSPAYDLLSTIPYMPSDELALSLCGERNMKLCTAKLFEKMSEKAGVPKRLVMNVLKDTVERTRHVWHEQKSAYALPKPMENAITEHMKRVPL
jgi:serine/threonine-protein kinase HipA